MIFKRTLQAVAVLVAAAALPLAAGERRPLPVFTIAAPDGAAVESGALPADGTWLLVHVQPHCAPCDALLAHIDSDERPAASRIVVIGAGMDGAAIGDLSARYPHMAASRWLADPGRAAAAALGIQASPTVLGLRRQMIEWRLAGSVRDPRELESILFSWLEKR